MYSGRRLASECRIRLGGPVFKGGLHNPAVQKMTALRLIQFIVNKLKQYKGSGSWGCH
jgi:hypothetical protein